MLNCVCLVTGALADRHVLCVGVLSVVCCLLPEALPRLCTSSRVGKQAQPREPHHHHHHHVFIHLCQHDSSPNTCRTQPTLASRLSTKQCFPVIQRSDTSSSPAIVAIFALLSPSEHRHQTTSHTTLSAEPPIDPEHQHGTRGQSPPASLTRNTSAVKTICICRIGSNLSRNTVISGVGSTCDPHHGPDRRQQARQDP